MIEVNISTLHYNDRSMQRKLFNTFIKRKKQNNNKNQFFLLLFIKQNYWIQKKNDELLVITVKLFSIKMSYSHKYFDRFIDSGLYYSGFFGRLIDRINFWCDLLWVFLIGWYYYICVFFRGYFIFDIEI